MKKSILVILLGVIALSSCKKYVQEKDLDKEARIGFPLFGLGLSVGYTDFRIFESYTQIYEFDKRDYPRDSITLNAILNIQRPWDSAVVRLYNITDSVPIENSTIYGTYNSQNQPTLVHSNNIAKSLPDKKITLALQARGSNYGNLYSAYINLRRY
jgi:hypothetical protein